MTEEDHKVLLIVKAYPNFEQGKAEYDWEFPDKCDISRMMGVLDLIKHELLHRWKKEQEEDEE